MREYEPELVKYVNPWDIGNPKYTDSVVVRDYLLRIDQDGFIMPSRLHTVPDWSLVFLGGSTTECMFVDESKRFPYVVGRLLEEETGKKINSFNGGKSGNTSFHFITTLLGKVIPLKPDVVIMMENINDLSVLLLEKSYWNNNPTRGPLLTILPDDHFWLYYIFKGFKNLLIKHFYDEAWGVIDSIRKPPPDEFAERRGLIQIDERSTSEILTAFQKNIELFVYICRLYNIVPVLMTQENRLTDQSQFPFLQQGLAQGGIEYMDYKHLGSCH